MSVLITGASGFIGKNLTGYLQHHRSHFQQLDRTHLLTVTDRDIDQCNAIVHLAGKAHDLKKISSPDEYYQVNFELTKRLYDAFLRSDATKFIFISSVKAVADTLDEPLTEQHIPDPQTHYGKSKLMAEEYIQAQPLPPGRSYYILRPCMIHGPGNKGNLNLLYNFATKGLPYPLASFKNERSFLSVENLCFVINEIINRDDIATGVYNVADDRSLSTNQLMQTIGATIGKKVSLWHIPVKLVQVVANMGNWLKLPLNSERLKKLTENYIVDNHKIKSALQLELPVEAQEGIAQTIRSFAGNDQ